MTVRERGHRRAVLAPFAALLLLSISRPGEAEPQVYSSPASAGVSASGSELERLLARLDSEEKALSTELSAGTKELETVRQRVLWRGRAYYKLVRAGLLPAGGGFDSLVDHAAKVERTRMALERDLAAEKRLMARGIEIGERLQRLRAEREPLVVQKEAMLRARTALAQADERRAAFARAFDTSTRPDHVAIYGADLGPTEANQRLGFRSMKGRLLLPITGRAEVRRFERPGGVRGVELSAPTGAPVRSVAAGRVAFADQYDDYGLTILLDHGDHYYSMYSSLGAAEIRVGEVVPAGARIGTVGRVGDGQPSLIFEIRKNAGTVDAATWLGL